MKRKVFLVIIVMCLAVFGGYLYKEFRNNLRSNNTIQFEVVYWMKGDLNIGRFLSKNVYVKNFKNDEKSFEHLKKFAEESLPIKDPKLDIGEIIFFDSKEASTVIQAIPKIEKDASMGFPLSITFPPDETERIKKFKKSIIAIYFRLPNEDPKFIKFPEPVFEP